MKTTIFARMSVIACVAVALLSCGGSTITMDVVQDSSHNDAVSDTADVPHGDTDTNDSGSDVMEVAPDVVSTDTLDHIDTADPQDVADIPDITDVSDTTDIVEPPDTSDIDVCVPQCDGVECGDDGCGGWCAWCGEGKVCRNQVCTDYDCGQGWSLIPAGQMSIPNPAGGPAVTVTMTRAICIRDTETTNADWLAIPEYKGILPSFDAASPCLDCPVDQISWFDAVDYCNLLSKNAGMESCVFLKNSSSLPCARIPSTGRVTSCAKGVPYDSVYTDCAGYRVPTRTEWLFAAMNGRWKSSFPGSGISDFAWNNQNAGGNKHSTAQLSPMESGTYDILGNVWEIVWDAAVEDLTVPPSGVDPTGAAIEGGLRLRMGGSFFSNPLTLWPPPVAVCSSVNAGDLATGLRPVFTAQ